MGWRRARFKDSEVWVQVAPDGQPAVRGGRVAMRYSEKEGARIYRAGASRIQVLDDAPIQTLPEGESADSSRPSKRSGGKGSGFGKAGTRTAAQARAAALDAQERIAALAEDVAVAFTDGACRGNPGPAGSGVFLKLKDGRTAEWARSLGRATNNIAELVAIGMALELLDEADLPPEAPAAIFSDSSYARGVLTQGWKARANQQLIADLKAQLKARPGVSLHWVAGHAGIAGNERADTLASEAARGQEAKRWEAPPV